jgi:hypothetical protein
VRKLLLTVHVVVSVGWLGAVAAFLALAIGGTTSAMGIVGWYVIVPASIASVVSGVVQGLATPWGLFRHYWVLIKLVMSVLASTLLVVHMMHLQHAGSRIIVDAAAALVVLLVATVLSIYKPRGLTRYGRRV